MSKSTNEGAENLHELAEEVEREREEKGHTPFDDAPSTEADDGKTREDHENDSLPLSDVADATRAGIVGAAGRVNRSGI